MRNDFQLYWYQSQIKLLPTIFITDPSILSVFFYSVRNILLLRFLLIFLDSMFFVTMMVNLAPTNPWLASSFKNSTNPQTDPIDHGNKSF